MKSPYLEVPALIGKLVQNQKVPRTGAPITSEAGPLKIITTRITNWNQIVPNLPCIYIDVDPSGILYDPYDQGVDRLIPVMIMVYIPISTRGEPEDEANAKDLEADADIKTVFSDLEEVLNSGTGQLGVVHRLILKGGGIAWEPWQGGDEAAGVRLRTAVIACDAVCKVR